MSAPDQISFLTLAEREFSAGIASNANGKLAVTGYKFAAGKELDDAKDEIKSAFTTLSSLSVQASMPFAVLSVKSAEVSTPEALLPYVQKTSGIDAADLRIAVVDSSSGPTALCFSKSAVAARIKEVSNFGAQSVKLYCRGVNTISAIRESVESGKIDKPVLYLDILPATTRILVASKEGIADLGYIDTGSDAILEQVMAALGLKFPGSAAKLFYGDLYDFDEHAPKLISVIADKARGRIGSASGKISAPAYLYACGLPSSRTTLLSGKLADALSLNAISNPMPIEATDGSVPTYVSGASFGITKIFQASGPDSWMINLSEPETSLDDAMAKLMKPAAAKAAPAPVTAPAAKATTPAAPVAKPVAPAQVKPAPAPAAKPVLGKPTMKPANGKTIVPPAKPIQKPAAAAPAKTQEAPKTNVTAAPNSSTAATAKTSVPKGKNNNLIIYGGVGAAAAILAIIAIVALTGKKSTPAQATTPASVTPTKPAPAAEKPVPAKDVAKPVVNTETAKPSAATTKPDTTSTAKPVATAATTPVAVPATAVAEPAPAPVAEPPPPPPVPTTGSVSIQTNPVDAEVYIDGQLKGRSPLIVDDLPVGSYTVEIRKENYRSETKKIEIAGGQTENLNDVALVMERGTLVLGTDPDGISYVIKPVSSGAGVDDASILKGKTPADLSGLKPGSYTVSFQRSGWKAYDQTIEIKAAQKTRANFTYKSATVRLESTPEGADVIVAGKSVGKTPLTLDDVAEGAFVATVQLDAYEPETVKLDVPFGGKASKEMTLLKLDRVITSAAELDVLPSHEGGMNVSIPADILAGNSGTVLVRFVIAPSGKVENAEIINGSKLSAAAEHAVASAVRSWTFTPGSRKGFPMRAEVVIPVAVK